MRKKTIGEVLRLARRSQGLNLRDIEDCTDIQLPYLEALENNDFDALPSSYYTRSFLKKYAEAVDLESDIILEAYEKGLMITYDEVEVSDDQFEDRLSRRQRKYKQSYTPVYYFALISIAIVVFITYFVWAANQNNVSTPSASSVSMVSSGSSETAATSSQEASSSAQPTYNIQVSGEGSSLSATVSGVSDSVNLSITAGDNPSWISVSNTDLAGGVTLSSSNPSVSTTINTDTTTQIVLGNTEGVTVKINDQTVDLSGLTSLTGTISLTVTG